VKHRLTQLVLIAALLTVPSELEIGGLETLLEAKAPERAAVSIDGVVGGLADKAKGCEVLVRSKEGADVLVELGERNLVNGPRALPLWLWWSVENIPRSGDC
jgi:hypothetical protein